MQVNQALLQDPENFSQLYDHTQIIIFRFIYGLHGGPLEEVEDLTCDTYYRAWKARSRFRGDEHDALCWLFTIARHLVIDAHRHKKASQEGQLLRLDDTNFEFNTQSGSKSPEEQAAIHDQFNRLWRILHDLPNERRELLVLRYMLGWKVKEIADYLKMEENTVSVYIKRCLEQIRQGMSTEETRR
jgi:RNA polymerase sigma-70 factor (ECF subfamily)